MVYFTICSDGVDKVEGVDGVDEVDEVDEVDWVDEVEKVDKVEKVDRVEKVYLLSCLMAFSFEPGSFSFELSALSLVL